MVVGHPMSKKKIFYMTARRATFCIFLPSKILAYCEAMLSLVYIYISQVRT